MDDDDDDDDDDDASAILIFTSKIMCHILRIPYCWWSYPWIYRIMKAKLIAYYHTIGALHKLWYN